MAGQILADRYEVKQQLGKQFGRWTLLASDLEAPELDLVVLKLLFIDENMGVNDLKLFEREVETLKSLQHPAIPSYLGYFELDLPKDGRALALVRTYIPGKSLSHYLQDHVTLSESAAKQIARELLDILRYLHSRPSPVVHRDIKPSNILWTDDRVYLIDFGSVKNFTSNESASFTIVGTEGYMPPEQFSGHALIPSDLYSLGITLITMLSGTPANNLKRRGVRVDVPAILNLEPAFTSWLEWMTEPRLDRRAKSAEEALRALNADQIIDSRTS